MFRKKPKKTKVRQLKSRQVVSPRAFDCEC